MLLITFTTNRPTDLLLHCCTLQFLYTSELHVKHDLCLINIRINLIVSCSVTTQKSQLTEEETSFVFVSFVVLFIWYKLSQVFFCFFSILRRFDSTEIHLLKSQLTIDMCYLARNPFFSKKHRAGLSAHNNLEVLNDSTTSWYRNFSSLFLSSFIIFLV